MNYIFKIRKIYLFFIIIIFIFSFFSIYFFLTFNVQKIINTTISIDEKKINAIIETKYIPLFKMYDNFSIKIENQLIKIQLINIEITNNQYSLLNFIIEKTINVKKVFELSTFIKIDNIPLYQHIINFI